MFTSREFDEFAIGMGIKVMGKLMGRPRHLAKELLNLLSERLRRILEGGIRC